MFMFILMLCDVGCGPVCVECGAVLTFMMMLSSLLMPMLVLMSACVLTLIVMLMFSCASDLDFDVEFAFDADLYFDVESVVC